VRYHNHSHSHKLGTSTKNLEPETPQAGVKMLKDSAPVVFPFIKHQWLHLLASGVLAGKTSWRVEG